MIKKKFNPFQDFTNNKFISLLVLKRMSME